MAGFWANYQNTETHQVVYTGTERTSDYNYHLFVRLDPDLSGDDGFGEVTKLQISHAGHRDTEEQHTIKTVSRDAMWDENGGFKIPLSEIVSTWKAEYGSYEANPLHLTVVPLNEANIFRCEDALRRDDLSPIPSDALSGMRD